MSGLSPELRKKILSAQTVGDTPPSSPLVPYRNIADLLRRKTEEHEQKIFLIFFDEHGHRVEYSYRDFYEEVCRTANLLFELGISRGDRVATLSTNHAATVILSFAAFMTGAVVVPLNAGEDDRRLIYILQNSEAKLAFVLGEFSERIRALQTDVPCLKTIIQAGGSPVPPLLDFHADVSRQSQKLASLPDPEIGDDALVVYTSGTTGNPKGVVLSQYNLLVDAMAISEWHRLSADQRMMCVLPIHHVNGTVVTLFTPLYVGGSVVLNQKFHTAKFFERISAEKVSVVSVVPTLLQFLVHANVPTDTYNLSHFRHIICGAGPLTVELVQRFEKLFRIPVVHGYGLSETTCYSCFLPVDLPHEEHRRWLTKYGFPSIGVPLPVNEMAIHDENGNEVNEGERGEIVIRGHNVMKYYFNNAEANESAFTHGWFRSGDEGFVRYDDEGRQFFFITGRIKELIIRGGVNISPFEIDEVLMHIPGVLAGIAVGFENDWYGEEVGAYVKLKDGSQLSEQDIISHCRKQLPFPKSPKVVVLADEIPVTSTGKYQRNRCRELFGQWKTTQFRDEEEKT